MKTYRHLYDQVTDFAALLAAFRKARRGKRDRPEVAEFEFNLEGNLFQLQDELRSGTYRLGAYRNFYVHERKLRLISAAPFRDRVVHHALCAVLDPIWERRFIHDTYACRPGKGTHRALDRCQEFSRRYVNVLQCDVHQFFPAIDHAILRGKLARLVADPDVLWLIDGILDSGAGVLAPMYQMEWFAGDDLLAAQRPRGLPVGNLTSQSWANIYLDSLDQFVKRELRCPAYVRYCDDFLLFGDDKQQLHAFKERVRDHLAGLRLALNWRRSTVYPTRTGIPFLGFRVFPTHRRLRADNVRLARRRLRRQRDDYRADKLTAQQFRESLVAWIGHARHADTYRLRRALLSDIVL
ncbi:MAG: hypothetical protein KDE23_20680 [Caldilinea sp.]|nr:hypothetical protein [Caldilinea sp.]